MATKKFSLTKILPLVLALMIDNMSFGALFPLIASMFEQYPQLFFQANVSSHMIDVCMSLAYLLMPLGMFFGASFLGDLSDMWGRRTTMIVAMIGIGIGYALMMFSILISSVWVFLLGRLVSGLFAGSQSIGQAAAVDMTTPKTKAFAMSLLTFAVSMGFTLGPFIVSVFTEMSQVAKVRFMLPLLVIGLGSFASSFWLFQSFHETYKVNKKGTHSFFASYFAFCGCCLS